ncbi:hypothetical protein E1B28_007622 [Marasmius oreades]|uniref:Uncharacterized protein n=1 Tax=Marasmius oreades TaxID=181124 RepID=A0A9P7UTN3_9AGAR|nr:uncharacterized protein E1B28_007622 [Marasmius oreades]KAG7093992.1 hypothetical protein E1B28_007622 [Marasmius oreades]
MFENQAPEHTVTVRHTVHFRKHHLGPTLLAQPSHRTSLPTRTILRTSRNYNGTSFGSGHPTRTTRILSCITNVELASQHGAERRRSVYKRKSIIVTSPSSTRRYQSPISPSRVRSPRKSSPLRPPLFPGIPLSPQTSMNVAQFPPPTVDPYCPSPIHSPHTCQLGSPTPGFLNIYAPTPLQISPGSYFNTHSQTYHDPAFLQSSLPLVSSPIATPSISLHPELTSYCPLVWSALLPPTTARSRYPVSYPFDLDILSAPACPGVSILLIYIEGGLIAKSWTKLWGPIRSVLRPHACEITVFDVLLDIHTYLHTRLSLREVKHVRKKGYQELVDLERKFRVGYEGAACEVNEWDKPPKRLDIIAPFCGGDFMSMRYDGVWQMDGLELSLRLGWL